MGGQHSVINLSSLNSMFVRHHHFKMENLKMVADILRPLHYIRKIDLTETDLMLADCKLLDFLKEYQRIKRKLAISSNIHLRLHESIYGFWLFSFEQYNRIPGSYQTNSETVEIQIMRKFMMSGSLAHMQ